MFHKTEKSALSKMLIADEKSDAVADIKKHNNRSQSFHQPQRSTTTNLKKSSEFLRPEL